ncbi:hypothetical protein HDU97_005541 [Phlyctochytrium planicorne]|nr:hypothetical protein HDU97_005541 [Phlyctochytrium planicorne]
MEGYDLRAPPEERGSSGGVPGTFIIKPNKKAQQTVPAVVSMLRKEKKVVILAKGAEINKGITVVELTKRQVKEMIQETEIGYESKVDVWEPKCIADGASRIEVTKSVPTITITLRLKDADPQ